MYIPCLLYLIVCAIRARHELSKGLCRRKPRLQIVLFRCSVVELARYNVNHPIRQLQRLVKLLRNGYHLLEHFPRLIVVGGGYAKLFHLFELVDAEDAGSVSAVGARLVQGSTSKKIESAEGMEQGGANRGGYSHVFVSPLQG